jgi:hypothetical protein
LGVKFDPVCDVVLDGVVWEVGVGTGWVLSSLAANLEPVHFLIEEDLEWQVVEVLTD